jgi:hypothetical protein
MHPFAGAIYHRPGETMLKPDANWRERSVAENHGGPEANWMHHPSVNAPLTKMNDSGCIAGLGGLGGVESVDPFTRNSSVAG